MFLLHRTFLPRVAIATTFAIFSSALGAVNDSHNVAVSATIAPKVKVSGLKPSTFGAIDVESSSGTSKDNNMVCIFSNVASNYTVTATSNNEQDGSFRMKATNDNYLNYSVTWYDSPTAGAGNSMGLSSSVASLELNNADTEQVNCADSGSNASVRLHVSQADAARAVPAAYTDTLTFLITSI